MVSSRRTAVLRPNAMTETQTTGAVAVVVLIGHDVASAQAVVKGLTASPGFAVVAAVDGGDLVTALKTTSALPIVEVDGGTMLAADHVYVLPPKMQARLELDSIIVDPPNGPGRLDRLLR